MKKEVGLWIDQTKAVIVVATEQGEESRLIISKDERQYDLSDKSPRKELHKPKPVPTRGSNRKTAVKHLNIYYDAVIACIRDADSILIFGPNDSKNELKECLARNNLSERII